MTITLLQEHKQLTDLIKATQLRLEAIESNENFQGELEFESKLRDLLNEYGKALPDIVAILDPARGGAGKAAKPAGEKQTRKPREIKRYKNPHTGETVETKGGNHAVLKNWKTEHGKDEVESWVQR